MFLRYDAEILRHYLDPAYQPKYTLMEVKQRGMTAYIKARNIQNALQAARIVRTHLKAGKCLKPLEDEFLGPVLDADEYGRQLSGWKTEPCVRGTISIDMEGRTFSFEDRDNPWAEYSLRHISSAVYRADRKRVLRQAEISEESRRKINSASDDGESASNKAMETSNERKENCNPRWKNSNPTGDSGQHGAD